MADIDQLMSELTDRAARRIALIGADGMLGQAVLKMAPAGYDVQPYSRADLDITIPEQLRARLLPSAPEVIINCAAYTKVDDCETHESEATQINGAGPGHLAHIAKEAGATLVHISTDYVFDGEKRSPYVESDATNPQSAYGRSKLAGEQAIFESGLEQFYIVRTSWLYGPGRGNFVETMLRLAVERDELRVVADQRGSPTYTNDLAEAIFRLLEAEQTGIQSQRSGIEYGIYHFSNEGDCSWHEFAAAILGQAMQHGIATMANNVTPISTEEYPAPATRPKYSVLSRDKYVRMTSAIVPDWRDGLARYMACRYQIEAAKHRAQR